MPHRQAFENIIEALIAHRHMLETAIHALRGLTRATGTLKATMKHGATRRRRRGIHWTQTPTGRKRLEEIKAERRAGRP